MTTKRDWPGILMFCLIVGSLALCLIGALLKSLLK